MPTRTQITDSQTVEPAELPRFCVPMLKMIATLRRLQDDIEASGINETRVNQTYGNRYDIRELCRDYVQSAEGDFDSFLRNSLNDDTARAGPSKPAALAKRITLIQKELKSTIANSGIPSRGQTKLCEALRYLDEAAAILGT
jgi:hypothetical protein